VYRLWMKVGAILGFINTTIILTVVFFVIFTPASFILRLLGKDPMKRKYQAKTTSYREIKTENNSGLKMEEPY
ncbi:MAG: SxtJ family membrane protein, partial [bacterium]